MSTLAGAIVTLVVLSAAGALPTLWWVGVRWVSLPLLPLVGAVVAAMAATCFVAVGLGFMAWFVGIALVAAVAAGLDWWARPGSRPWTGTWPGSHGGNSRFTRVQVINWVVGGVGLIGTVMAAAWGLRALATPTVGFDARALWLMRSGWFLQSHHQLLVKLRVPDVKLLQSAYPPLVSASNAVAWSLTGHQSLRLGVVVIALLDTCALTVAAFALVEAGRRLRVQLPSAAKGSEVGSGAETPRLHDRHRNPSQGRGVRPGWAWLAPIIGLATAPLLVTISFGITEPFMTNGYADPIWSLAGVGAVAFGLQLQEGGSDRGVALILILVAGLSKNEGVANALPLVALVSGRAVLARWRGGVRREWWRPAAAGAAVLAAIASWPELMKAVHARGATTSLSRSGHLWTRTVASYHGMAPYLHVLVLAVPVAVVGSLALWRVRRASGLGNDLWAWAAVAGGLVTVGGALVFGSAAIVPWLQTTVHRVTEFDALTGWWIVAMWGVVASAAPVMSVLRGGTRDGHELSGTPDNPDASLPPPTVRVGRAGGPVPAVAELGAP